jgi:hypothetical protein
VIADFVIYATTRKPEITATLKDNGVVVDLTGATVKFQMRPVAGGTLKVDTAATVVSATLGQVKYSWASADVNAQGTYRGWWLVTFSDTTTAIFPSRKTYVIEIKGAP